MTDNSMRPSIFTGNESYDDLLRRIGLQTNSDPLQNEDNEDNVDISPEVFLDSEFIDNNRAYKISRTKDYLYTLFMEGVYFKKQSLQGKLLNGRCKVPQSQITSIKEGNVGLVQQLLNTNSVNNNISYGERITVSLNKNAIVEFDRSEFCTIFLDSIKNLIYIDREQ